MSNYDSTWSLTVDPFVVVNSPATVACRLIMFVAKEKVFVNYLFF
jgi:hypothetical protein